jgi:hypothetical protein
MKLNECGLLQFVTGYLPIVSGMDGLVSTLDSGSSSAGFSAASIRSSLIRPSMAVKLVETNLRINLKN